MDLYLTQEELFNKNVYDSMKETKYGCVDPIGAALVDRVPIHPSVYTSDFAYTQKFFQHVRNATLDEVKRHIAMIHATTGLDLTHIRFDEFEHFDGWADKKERRVRLYGPTGGNNIDLCTKSDLSEFITDQIRVPSMTPERLQLFSLETDRIKVPTWYTKFADANLRKCMLFHNFMIAFNNLGLDELAKREAQRKDGKRA